ncbi:MAG: hypothetical protein WCF23_23030 [Candidatus Nitrosopolaris sp.]
MISENKIQNVITTANLYQYVDITKFIEYSWGEYDLERYGGRCGYVKDAKIQGRVTVFLSGKMISTEGKSIHKSIQQLEHTMNILVKDKFIDSSKAGSEGSKYRSDCKSRG